MQITAVLGLLLPAPVVQPWLSSMGEFPFFMSQSAVLSCIPHKVPMDRGEIRVWLRVSPRTAPGSETGPVLVPVEGTEAAAAVPVHPPARSTRATALSSSTELGMDMAPNTFYREWNFF